MQGRSISCTTIKPRSMEKCLLAAWGRCMHVFPYAQAANGEQEFLVIGLRRNHFGPEPNRMWFRKCLNIARLLHPGGVSSPGFRPRFFPKLCSTIVRSPLSFPVAHSCSYSLFSSPTPRPHSLSWSLHSLFSTSVSRSPPPIASESSSAQPPKYSRPPSLITASSNRRAGIEYRQQRAAFSPTRDLFRLLRHWRS